MNTLFNRKLFSFSILMIGLVSTILSTRTTAFAQQQNVSETNSLKQVEIIVFSKIQPTGLISEQWEMPTKMPDVNHAIELVPFDKTRQVNSLPQLLPSTYWKLNQISAHLLRSGYAIIFHAAWVQDFSAKFDYPIHLLTFEEQSSNPVTAMNGTIDITLNRYFNVAIDLLFSEPVYNLTSIISSQEIEKNFHNIVNGVAYFQLKQNRRMKSDELNYIDHPLYGILIKITTFQNIDSKGFNT